ncbi:MAG: AlpA family phage regulatory protein [Candidatus Marinimicrobia bacterium]|nr:AlpA family phage regulatory protein [Candidatus Neomarinimicrobiota bacterium]
MKRSRRPNTVTPFGPPPTDNTLPLDEILRWREIEQIIKISRTTWWRWVRSGHAPQPIQLGPNSVGWSRSSIVSFLDERSAA